MGAQGTTTIDFGAFPGSSDATVTITGQTGIVTGSLVEAWIRPVATADHTAGEHMLEPIKVVAHSIVAGTGFDITGLNINQLNEPLASGGSGGRGQTVLADRSIGFAAPERGGMGTRLYGLFTVAWVWN